MNNGKECQECSLSGTLAMKQQEVEKLKKQILEMRDCHNCGQEYTEEGCQKCHIYSKWQFKG